MKDSLPGHSSKFEAGHSFISLGACLAGGPVRTLEPNGVPPSDGTENKAAKGHRSESTSRLSGSFTLKHVTHSRGACNGRSAGLTDRYETIQQLSKGLAEIVFPFGGTIDEAVELVAYLAVSCDCCAPNYLKEL
uniref:Uncharacterized protein n=1 Tax=Branchiostoma floridae TaxID=7739 RepID=C3YB27_BRAFL|eukprot:XP_002606479.1 hypothetical protein BRAFLDRAFT_93270 [Branchiostoma floridae]